MIARVQRRGEETSRGFIVYCLAIEQSGSTMTKRVWASVFAAALLIGAIAIWAEDSGALPLRSQHAQPAIVPVEQTVFVNAEGNLFHAATCADLHKPSKTMSGSEAIVKGYAPCTRCMRRALGQ